MYILAGDIGGTKAFLQLVYLDHSEIDEFEQPSAQQLYFHCKTLCQQRLLCANFHSLEALILHFLKSIQDFSEEQSIDFACLALPGPVDSDRVNLTNLPWQVEKHQLMHICQIEHLSFINDFYAAALAVPLVHNDQVIELYHGKRFEELAEITNPASYGNRLVVGAGTGLGVAPVVVVQNQFVPQASEGGHFDFAPISPVQQLILDWLWPKWPHVSYERLLSGSGLQWLYHFFKNHSVSNSYLFFDELEKCGSDIESIEKHLMGAAFANHQLKAQHIDIDGGPSAAEISLLAEQNDEAAQQALIEFVTIYAAFIGASALLWRAPGGIFIAGGIAEKIQYWLKQPYFQQAFLHKGRMTELLENTPVYLVADEELGLKGALLHNFL